MYRPLWLVLAVCGVDGLTKAWAQQALEPGAPVPVFGEVARLTLGYNTGVAFGFFASDRNGPVLLTTTALIIVGIAGWLLWATRTNSASRSAAALALVLGGAVANFVDRWRNGRVTDFLDVGLGDIRWPAFNLADSVIVVGVTLLVMALARDQPTATSGRGENHPS